MRTITELSYRRNEVLRREYAFTYLQFLREQARIFSLGKNGRVAFAILLF